MQYTDTTNKDGLLQHCEFLTGLGDGAITGSTLLKAHFTNLLNRRYDRVSAKLQATTGVDGFDDYNYADHSFGTFAINSGQNDYQFLTDEDGNTITDITGIAIKTEASGDYVSLDKLTLDSTEAQLIMSPNTSNTGTPTGYIERNNTVFLNIVPNFTLSAGGKVFYRLVPSYFATTDTTKKPGFAPQFHSVLSLGASYDWLMQNKPENVTRLNSLQAEIEDMMGDFISYTRMKNPTHGRIIGSSLNSH
jgi:hypothetical protein